MTTLSQVDWYVLDPDSVVSEKGGNHQNQIHRDCERVEAVVFGAEESCQCDLGREQYEKASNSSEDAPERSADETTGENGPYPRHKLVPSSA